MSELLDRTPYGPRDDDRLLFELNQLTSYHLEGCPAFARIWPRFSRAATFADIPYVHAGLFKRMELRTSGPDLKHERVLESSATTGATPSRIPLDARSAVLQSRSSSAILSDFVGSSRRPLLVIDSASSLRRRGRVSARMAAAFALKPLANRISFILRDPDDPTSVDWDEVAAILETNRELLVYGLTWLLWRAWGTAHIPHRVRVLLEGCRIQFVHSGGWKRLEDAKVDRTTFDRSLVAGLAPTSTVVDFYGLVEQSGMVFPECGSGFRHPPVWAEVLVRDPYDLATLEEREGLIQLMNVTAWGAPYHSVLTEDLGIVLPGQCPCGRSGKRFRLLGRLPEAEVRGCSNV